MIDTDEQCMVAFRIISAVGNARSFYMEAIHAARDNDFDMARKLIDKGENSFLEGHQAHMKLISQEADGNPISMSLILVHAEDQLMSAEQIGLMAQEMIVLHQQRFEQGKTIEALSQKGI